MDQSDLDALLVAITWMLQERDEITADDVVQETLHTPEEVADGLEQLQKSGDLTVWDDGTIAL